MNAFSNLSKKLLNLNKFKSTLYLQNIEETREKGIKTVKVISEKEITGTIGNIESNLVDNNNFFADDLIFYTVEQVDKLNNRLKYNDEIYSIVSVIPLTNLNNSPALYKVIMRK